MLYEIISWKEFHDACDKLLTQLKADCRVGQHSTVLAVPRGGLVAATIIAYGLKTNRLMTAPKRQASDRSDLVIVDDICDTGRTVTELRSLYKNAVFVAPYIKPGGRDLCQHWVRELPVDVWAVFPYAPYDEVNR